MDFVYLFVYLFIHLFSQVRGRAPTEHPRHRLQPQQTLVGLPITIDARMVLAFSIRFLLIAVGRRYLVSGSDDGTIKFWDIRRGKTSIKTVNAHSHWCPTRFSACLPACLSVCLYLCMCVCVCMYVCMYVCACVCLSVYVVFIRL